MSWTDERVETLKKMWAEGQSASQIAKELGGVTRNAVIGKVHRLGLSNRVGGAPDPVKAKADPEPKVETKPAAAAAKPAQPAAKAAPAAAGATRPDPAPAAAAA
ncbi:GcrA family cell cycle regulator, partial [Albidovulum sp.]|uniref:GcrA family cell cycle regulator n=1 Tax=Albidovulum sp. TaxID=1872424 RepID=UPI0039B87BA4